MSTRFCDADLHCLPKATNKNTSYYILVYNTADVSHGCTLEYLITVHMYGKIKRSHSIHMLSIQIDTKSYSTSVQQHQIVLVCKQNREIEFSITYVRLIDAVRLLDTLEYVDLCAV